MAESDHIPHMLKLFEDYPNIPKNCFFPSTVLDEQSQRQLSFWQNTNTNKLREEVAQLQKKHQQPP